MIKNFFRSKYAKAALTVILAGAALMLIYSVWGNTKMADVVAGVNDKLMPIYIGIVITFLLCPMYNKLVSNVYRMFTDENATTLGWGFSGMAGCSKAAAKRKAEGTGFFKRKSKKKRSLEFRAFRLARILASAICIIVVIGALLLVVYFILPRLVTSIIEFIEALPQNMLSLSEWTAEHFSRVPQISETLNAIVTGSVNDIIDWLNDHLMSNDMLSLITAVSTSLFNVVGVFGDVVIGLLIAVYLLNYKEHLFAIARKISTALFSKKTCESLRELFNVINETFIGFMVGRIIDALIIGVLTFIVLKVFDIPLVLIVSVIVGVTNVIPFFGPFIGAIPSFFLILLQDPMDALLFVVLITIIQQLDGNVIGPKVVGRQIGIDSFWVLISVLLGGRFFGFIGMLIGVPAFAVIYTYVDRSVIKRLKEQDSGIATDEYLELEKFGVDTETILRGENLEKQSDAELDSADGKN